MRTVEAVFTVTMRRNTKPKETGTVRQTVGGGTQRTYERLNEFILTGVCWFVEGKINYFERGRQV